MKQTFTLIFTFLCCTILFAQKKEIKGRILNSENHKPLAFATIVTPNSSYGTTSDIDGYFSLTLPSVESNLVVRLIGFKTDTVDISHEIFVFLKPQIYRFQEIRIYPGVNPAERIMKHVIDNREKNDLKNKPFFSCEVYDKVAYKSTTNLVDSSLTQEALNHLETHHLFMAESVLERSYRSKNEFYDKVVANKVSGFQRPGMALTSIDIQPFFVYDTYLNVFNKSYLGPLSENSWNKYLFLIDDTLVHNSDTTFVLSYRPKRGKSFDALKGFLYVNSQNWNVERFVAENFYHQIVSFKIQQNHKKYDDYYWYPEQLNTKIIFTELGLELTGEAYLSHFKNSVNLNKVKFDHLAYEIDTDAYKKNPSYWDSIRVHDLTEKEVNTYQYNDSIGNVYRFDNKMDLIGAAVSGKLSFGVLDLRVKEVLSFDRFEGMGLGLGVETNEKLVRWASVGGYYSYGLNDKRSKYGANLKLKPIHSSDHFLNFSYCNDLETPGRSLYYKDRVHTNTESYLRYLTNWKNEVEAYQIAFEGRVFSYCLFKVFGTSEVKRITNDYRYFSDIENKEFTTNQVQLTKVGIQFKYAYKEKFVRLFGEKLSRGTNSPIVWINFTQAFDDLLDGKHAYLKIEGKLNKKFQTRYLGHFGFSLAGGWMDSVAPFTELFLPSGAKSDRFLLQVDNSFQTMGYFEFAASEYVQLFYTHRLYRWYTPFNWTSPEFVMSHGAAWGELKGKNDDHHTGIVVKDLSKGYFESGLMANHLLRMDYYDMCYLTFGAGVFYRYGENALSNTSDNTVLKISGRIEF